MPGRAEEPRYQNGGGGAKKSEQNGSNHLEEISADLLPKEKKQSRDNVSSGGRRGTPWFAQKSSLSRAKIGGGKNGAGESSRVT